MERMLPGLEPVADGSTQVDARGHGDRLGVSVEQNRDSLNIAAAEQAGWRASILENNKKALGA